MAYKLVLDFGNTFKKLAVFNGQDLLELRTTKTDVIKEIEDLKQSYHQLSSAILSSVISIDVHLLQYLKTNFEFLLFDHHTPIPINNEYETPETLGKDRLAAAVGANQLFPGKNTLIIDAGSSITYELVDVGGSYLGGAISPGIRLRAMALNRFTDQLPMVDLPNQIDLLGKNTKSCIQSGILNGTISEVNAMIESFLNDYQELKIVLTGGDAIYFEKSLKYDIFASANLVLEGLNYILDFNEL